jgi:hypothetical protein
VHAFGMWLSYILGHVVDEVIMMYIIDESYILGTLVKSLASSMICTWFMDNVPYVYGYLDCGPSC